MRCGLGTGANVELIEDNSSPDGDICPAMRVFPVYIGVYGGGITEHVRARIGLGPSQ